MWIVGTSDIVHQVAKYEAYCTPTRGPFIFRTWGGATAHIGERAKKHFSSLSLFLSHSLPLTLRYLHICRVIFLQRLEMMMLSPKSLLPPNKRNSLLLLRSSSNSPRLTNSVTLVFIYAHCIPDEWNRWRARHQWSIYLFFIYTNTYTCLLFGVSRNSFSSKGNILQWYLYRKLSHLICSFKFIPFRK